MKPKLTLMITDDDRRMLNMCLARVGKAMLHQATDKSLVKAFNDLRFSIEMAEDIEDARAVALLYTTVQHALPGVVTQSTGTLRSVLEAIDRGRSCNDGEGPQVAPLMQGRRRARNNLYPRRRPVAELDSNASWIPTCTNRATRRNAPRNDCTAPT